MKSVQEAAALGQRDSDDEVRKERRRGYWRELREAGEVL
jgi:hypothetical protein